MSLPSPIPQDVYFRQQMEEGSANLLQRMLVARQGVTSNDRSDLVWKTPVQVQGYEPGTAKWRERQRVLRAIQDNEARIEAQRVSRDPCPRCNTRKDIGCKHFPRGAA